ncbi:MAG: GNAT family N-acetyltransferase [bacterium]|nr:MAG: GNAT family N-acetyltransferase [bacterium]
MSIQIREVQSKKDLKKFVLFPYKLYEENQYWVPPLTKGELENLLPDKNPAFEYCEAKYWLALKDNKIVGRIAGIINHKYIEKWNKNYAGFSRFDFVNDEQVSNALMERVENWAKSKGLEGIHGPIGFTNFDHQGMLVEGFNELPTIASTYNYDYYPKYIENWGYKKEVDYLEFEVKVPDRVPEKAESLTQLVLKKHKLKVVKAKSKKELLTYAKPIFNVINAAYHPLFASVDLSESLIDMYIKKYFSFILPEYVIIIFNEHDKVIGFQITIPSLSRAFQKANGRLFPFGFIHILRALKKPKYLDLYLVGIHPDYQGKGVSSIFMTELTKIAMVNDIISAESNSALEENKKVLEFWKYYDVRQHKRKRVYVKMF